WMDNNDRVLLVEGQDDEHVVRHLCLRSQPIPPFHIENKLNVDTLLDSIKQEVRVPGRKAVGILVDANDDLNARWSAVANRLREGNIDVPRTPEPTGTLIEGTSRIPRVGIWLMPDNTSPGELENFVSEMIPNDDPVWPRSQSYIDAIPEDDRKFIEKKIPRAKVHAWLATREEPRKMGVAIRAQDLRVDGPLSTTFANWLQQLFE
ncbi:MAG: hypothetical protein OXE49_08665, partial [Gemmatimonadetes bacterium]|nr:hypothetical protein [Gemmatimonadota bacterium]